MRTHLLLAAGLLTFIMVPAMAFQRPPTEEEKEKVRIRIGITKDQQAQLDALWKDNMQQSRDLSDRMNDLRRQLFSLYENYDYDRTQAEHLRKEIHQLYRKRLQLFGDAQEKMRRILSRDQFNKLQAVLKEQHEKFRRDWENRRGPGGRPGPPPPPGSGPGPL